MPITIEQMRTMSSGDLDALYRRGEVGQIPDGEAEGTALIAPGTRLEGPLEALIRAFAWQGKVFDANAGTLRNRLLAVGVQAVVAKIYRGPSWLDGSECIVLDYSKTSIIAGHVRDEIRRVAAGLYFGPVYWDRAKLVHFALQFPV
jgi:hypothetical protein